MGGDGTRSEGREAGREGRGSQREVGAVTVNGNFLFVETRVCRRVPLTRGSACSVFDIWESFHFSGHGEPVR